MFFAFDTIKFVSKNVYVIVKTMDSDSLETHYECPALDYSGINWNALM